MVLHGDAGIGKTRGAARFVQDNLANAIYIRCTPVGGTLTAMLRQLGTALKLPATRNRLELSMATVSYTHLDVYKRQEPRWDTPARRT